MQLNNKVYEAVKWIVQVVLPALGTLYFSLGNLWDFPFIEQVVGTVTAVALFLGIVVGVSKHNYIANHDFDGTMVVDTSDDTTDVYRLELNDEMPTLVAGGTVTFKVQDANKAA